MSTGQVEGGLSVFSKYLQLPPEHLIWRNIVINRRRTRHLQFIQPNLRRVGDDIELVNYPATYAGLIQSHVERYKGLPRGAEALEALEKIWRADMPYFQDIPV